jgi:hypothetical protein
MGRLLVILVGVAFALAACEGSPSDQQSESGGEVIATETRPGGQVVDTEAMPAEIAVAGRERVERTIGIYSAVVRQLVTKDHTFGGGPAPFERVFIVDGAVPRANDPGLSREAPRSFEPEVRAGILEELADLPPVEFVSDPDSVVVGRRNCAHVRRNGVLITLGPIEGGKDKATVPNGLYFACLGGQWLTYELGRANEGWRVTAMKGPYIIS